MAIKYINTPGTPPGINAINIARRNQNGLMPKNSPSPPHTPAIQRLFFDLRKGLSLYCHFLLLIMAESTGQHPKSCNRVKCT